MILMHNEIEEFKSNNLTKSYESDFGYDIKSPVDCILSPQTSTVIATKLHVWFPPILGAVIQSRSGLAIKYSIEASNAGVIDSGYTGELNVKLYNHSNQYYKILKGDRIAQILFFIRPEQFFKILPNYLENIKSFGNMNFTISERDISEWKKSERKHYGIGSSGK